MSAVRKYAFLLALLLLAAGCDKDRIREVDRPHTGVEFLFDESRLPELSISVPEDEWNRLLSLYDADNGTHEYVRCSSVVLNSGGITKSCTDAGLRLRGQTSRRRPEGSGGEKHRSKGARWRHVHFGLNCRVYTEKGDLGGVRRINLKYAKEDPTYIREHYCYEMLRSYGVWTGLRSSWCKLYLNIGSDSPVYMGVYLMTESVDMQYVKRRPEFGGTEGWLWKCAAGANLRDATDKLFHMDDNSSRTYAYDLKNGESEADFALAKAQLVDFITNLNKLKGDIFRNWIKQVCDVDLMLKLHAANAALGHWDDYWNNMNNFYLYFSGRDQSRYKVYMVAYDYDNTLGTSNNCGVQNDAGRHDPYNWGQKQCVLMYRLLEVPEFRAKYTAYLRDFAQEENQWTGKTASAARIRVWQALIEPYLKNDTREDMELRDAPASWGNHHEYRLLEDSANNWFTVKAASLAEWTAQ